MADGHCHIGVCDQEFQSLLCWIIRCGSTGATSSCSTPPGFNPCCVGSFAVAEQGRPEAYRRKPFQSLLCWIIRCGMQIGEGSVGEFWVSILVVLDHSLWRHRTPDRLEDQEFQSLLCWIIRCGDDGARPRGIQTHSFNPCCVGSFAVAWRKLCVKTTPGGFNPCCVGSFAVAVQVIRSGKGLASFNPCCVGSFAVAASRG